MRFVHVRLDAPAERLRALADFYGRELGVALRDPCSPVVGETTIEFAAGSGEPFYHFALLVPGNRFDAALAWARAKTELLPDEETGDVVFDFDNWNAYAVYFHDPAGNIVELIAHRGVDETAATGEFRATELVGLSELGLVGEPSAMARALDEQLGLALWDGTVDEPGGLAFVDSRARTLILAPPGRGWLPTGRTAEPHPVKALLSHTSEREVQLEAGRYRIKTTVRFAERGVAQPG